MKKESNAYDGSKAFKNWPKLMVIFVFVAIAVFGVGSSFAYFTNKTSVEKANNTGDYGTLYKHSFKQEDGWLPGTDSAIKASVTNNGRNAIAVRAKIVGVWKRNDVDISSELENGEQSVIPFVNEHWFKNGEYYYYDTLLEKNASTTNVVDHILFNPNTEILMQCEGDELSQNCLPTTVYSDAEYSLEITFETIQSNVYQEQWRVDLNQKSLNNRLKSTAIYDDIDIDSDLFLNSNTGVYYYNNSTNNYLVYSSLCYRILTYKDDNYKLSYVGPYNGTCVSSHFVDTTLKESILSVEEMSLLHMTEEINSYALQGQFFYTSGIGTKTEPYFIS